MNFIHHPQCVHQDPADDAPKTPKLKKKKSFSSWLHGNKEEPPVERTPPELPPIRPFSTLHMPTVLGDASTASEAPHNGSEEVMLVQHHSPSNDEVKSKVSHPQRASMWRRRQQQRAERRQQKETERQQKKKDAEHLFEWKDEDSSARPRTNIGMTATNVAWVESPAPEHVVDGRRTALSPEEPRKGKPSSWTKLKKKCSKPRLTETRACADDPLPMLTSRIPTPFTICPSQTGEGLLPLTPGFKSQIRHTPKTSNSSTTPIASPESSINFSMPSGYRKRSDTMATSPDAQEDNCSRNWSYPPRDEPRKMSRQQAPVVPAPEAKLAAISTQTARESVHGYSSFSSTRAEHSTFSADIDDEAEQNWRNTISFVVEDVDAALNREAQATAEEQKEETNRIISPEFPRASDYWRPKSDIPIERETLEQFKQAVLEANRSTNPAQQMEKLRSTWFGKITGSFKSARGAKAPGSTKSEYSRTMTPTLSKRPREGSGSITTYGAAHSTPSSIAPSGYDPSGFTPLASFSSGSTAASLRDRYMAQTATSPYHDDMPQQHDGLGISTSFGIEDVPSTTNPRRIKVDRNSKIADRFVPKRNSAFFNQLAFEANARVAQQARKDSKLSPLEIQSSFAGQPFVPDSLEPDSPELSEQNSSPENFVHAPLRTQASSATLRGIDPIGVSPQLSTPRNFIHPALRTEASAKSLQYDTEDSNRNICDAAERYEDRSATPTPRHPYPDAEKGDGDSDRSSYSGLSQYDDSSMLALNSHDSVPDTPRGDSPTIPTHMAPVLSRTALAAETSTPLPGSPRPSNAQNPASPIVPTTPSSASKPLYQQILEKSGPYKHAYGRIAGESSSMDATTVSDVSQSASEHWSTRAMRRHRLEDSMYSQQVKGGALRLPDESDTRSLVSSVEAPSTINNDLSDIPYGPAPSPPSSPLPAIPAKSALVHTSKTGFSPSERPGVPTRSQFHPPASPSPLRFEKTRLSPDMTSALTPPPLQFGVMSPRSATGPQLPSSPLRFCTTGMSPEDSPSPLRVGNMGLRRLETSDQSPSTLRFGTSSSRRMVSAGNSPSMEQGFPSSPLGVLRKNPDAFRARQHGGDSPRRVTFAEFSSASVLSAGSTRDGDVVDHQIEEILSSNYMQGRNPQATVKQSPKAAYPTITPSAGVMSDYESMRLQHETRQSVFVQGNSEQEVLTIPTVNRFAEVTPEYQHIRRHLQVELLMARKEGAPKHPYHDFAWDSTNIKCKNRHANARMATDSALVSPLIGTTQEASEQDDGINQCLHCGKACCHFANQIIMCNNTDDKSLKSLFCESVKYLRANHPTGLEPWSVLMVCSLCDNIFCTKCGTVEDGQPTCKMCATPEPS